MHKKKMNSVNLMNAEKLIYEHFKIFNHFNEIKNFKLSLINYNKKKSLNCPITDSQCSKELLIMI